MMSTSVVGLALLAVHASAQSLPTITADGQNLAINTPGGDVQLMWGTSMNTQGVGATLSTLQSSIDVTNANILAMNMSINYLQSNAAMSQDVADTYLTQTAAMATYQTQAAMSDYATLQQATNLADSAREYADDIVTELANLINSSYSDIINSHIALGVLSANGTLTGNINVNGDGDLASMQSLLDHVTAVTGNVIIQNVQSAVSNLGTGLFSRCTSVGGYVYIRNNPSLTTLGAAFPALNSVGGQILIQNNANLANVGAAFANLTYVGGALTISGSSSLGSSTGPQAFASLTSVGGVTLSTGFSAATGIYVGDILTGSIASIGTMLNGKEVITGSLVITDGTTIPASLNALRAVGGRMALQGTSIVSLDGAFPSLGAVGGDLYIYSNSQLTTFGTAFANLRMVQGTLTFSYHRTAAFTSLAGAFPQLTNITGNLYIQYNDYLSTVTGAFPRLKWVTGLIYPYYLYRLEVWDNTVMPQLEYAGGIRFYYCWYTNVPGATRSLNNAFPELLRIGPNGFYMYYAYYLETMNNVCPLLTRIDGMWYLYRCYYALNSIQNSFQRVTYIGSYFYTYYNGYSLPNGGTINFSGSFRDLQYVGSYFYIYYSNFGTITNQFNNLETVQSQFYIYYCQRLTAVSNSFNSLTSIGTFLYIYNNPAMTSITNSFTSLTQISTYFYIYGNSQLQRIEGSFTSLRSIGTYFYIMNNYALTSLNGSFGNLTSVGTNLYIYGNRVLQSLGTTAFQNFQSCTILYFYGNGATSSSSSALANFCNSANSRLCPSTSTWQNSGWQYDTDNCCNTYCQSNSC